MDRRWRLVLNCLDTRYPPFSKGTLVSFRHRLIEHDLDRRLVERTVELAERTRGFGPRQLRAALDSSPLSAALDENWEEPAARDRALRMVLGVLERVAALVEAEPNADPAARESLAAARQVLDQDVVSDGRGKPTLRKGVASDRRISIDHGRKTRSLRVDGYKRHVLRDPDSGLMRAVGVTLANAPEASVTDQIDADLGEQGVELGDLHIDRAYLTSWLVQERSAELEVFCKAFPVRNGPRFSRLAFQLDWERREMRCPQRRRPSLYAGWQGPVPGRGLRRLPAARAVHHQSPEPQRAGTPDERLLAELRARQHTPEDRARLHERVVVEHSLAHVDRWQGRRVRYRGQRKNLHDLRRTAVVHNLHVIARRPQKQAA